MYRGQRQHPVAADEVAQFVKTGVLAGNPVAPETLPIEGNRALSSFGDVSR